MADVSQIGAFIPTTRVYDVGFIEEIKADSPEFKQLIVRLTQDINNISLLLNIKDTGIYPLTEFINSQIWFPPTPQEASRQDFRIVINFGALPNAGAKSVVHGLGITSTYTATHIWAAATDTTGLTMIPIPYASPTALNENIKLDVNTVPGSVTITTGTNRTNYNVCYVVIEYLKN